MPEMQFVQTNVVAQFECVPVLHGAHDVGHEIELMSAGVATRLGGEEPPAPAGHPFMTKAEVGQERVPVEVNALSGQASSSLAGLSRKMSAPLYMAVLPVNVELPIPATLLDVP